MNTIALLLRSLAIGVLTVLITFPSRAESAGVDVRQLGQDIMIVDEIRPDMKGYGLTVFRGAEIEKFRVEVVSVMGPTFPTVSPKRSVIWIRCPDQILQDTGPVAGMSGSPIYLWDEDERKQVALWDEGKREELTGGRLIGAFAYGFPFSKDCYAGVQPIELMREVGQRATNLESEDTLNASGLDSGRMLRGLFEQLETREIEPWHTIRSRPLEALWPFRMHQASPSGVPGPQRGELVNHLKLPVPLPTGLPSEVFTPLFESAGLRPVAIPAGTMTGKLPSGIHPDAIRLESGSVVAIPLVYGDVDVSGSGTVTEVLADGRILAFGHEMFGRGRLDLPMATGYVHFCVPHLLTSFKIGGSHEIRGALVRDELSAVVGDRNGRFSTAEVEIDVQWPDGAEQSYQYQIVHHHLLTSGLAGLVTTSSLFAERNLPAESTVHMTADLAFVGNRSVSVQSTVPGGSVSRLIMDIVPPIAVMMDNPFEPMNLEKMHAKIRVDPHLRVADILNVTLENAHLAPGDQLAVNLKLQPHRKPIVTKRIEMRVPDDLPDGLYDLFVASAKEYMQILHRAQPHLLAASSADELHELIQHLMNLDETAVYLVLQRHEKGLAIGRATFPKLPSSRLAMFDSPTNSIAKPYTELTVVKASMPFVTMGRYHFRVPVQREPVR